MAKRRPKTRARSRKPGAKPKVVVTTHTVKTTRLGRYGYGDYTEDSLDSASMAVNRAAASGDCAAAQKASDKFEAMAKFVSTSTPKYAKRVQDFRRQINLRKCKV